MNDNVLNYILEFLIGSLYNKSDDKKSGYNFIKYTDNLDQIKTEKVVIKASGFFKPKIYGTPKAEPDTPLALWEGVPLLFGAPYHEWINEGKTLLIHADVIASTYYLISRYEEMYKRNIRDDYGRFPLEASLLYRANCLDRPLVDEYAVVLRNLLQSQDIIDSLELYMDTIPQTFKQINLGIDVYRPFLYTGIRGFFLRILKKEDPYNTFDDIYILHNTLMDRSTFAQIPINTTLFLKSTQSPFNEDKPKYNFRSMRKILKNASRQGIRCGLLSSYASSKSPTLIKSEASKLRLQIRKIYLALNKSRHKHHNFERENRFKCFKDLDLASSRHSYLALSEPEDIKEILTAGIRHDYTMGYYNEIGFRLGTSRPVRFINPNTRSLSPLIMHPLTISSNGLLTTYNKIQDETIFWRLIEQMLNKIKIHNGELNLSFQNENFNKTISPLTESFFKKLNSYISDQRCHNQQ